MKACSVLGLGGSRGGSFFSDGETRGRATVHACAVQLNLQLRFSDRAAGVGFAWARSGGAPADGGAERSGRLAGPGRAQAKTSTPGSTPTRFAGATTAEKNDFTISGSTRFAGNRVASRHSMLARGSARANIRWSVRDPGRAARGIADTPEG